jgi:small subunit ribosomal protein S20
VGRCQKLFTRQVIFDKLFLAMPVIKSAIKKARQDVKAREHNRGLRDNYKNAVKSVKKLVVAGETKKVGDALKKAFSELDRAAKRNIIHKNNASRRKSRLNSLAKAAAPKTKKK